MERKSAELQRPLIFPPLVEWHYIDLYQGSNRLKPLVYRLVSNPHGMDMGQGVSRRQFLRGDIGNLRPVIHPPWFQTEQHFLAHCNRCGDCLSVCETGILECNASGYPQVNFQNGECSFCAACVKACSSGALVQQPNDAPWSLHATINTASCLASRGVLCQVCADHCLARAIRFARAAYAIATPILDQTACTGCGACVAPCPVNAIRMEAR